MTSLKDPRIRMTIPPLTARQREVLGLLARGYTNPQIGEALGISLDGAKWHVAEIMARLGVDSREDAAAVWRDYNRAPRRLARAMRGFLPVAAWAKWGAAVVGAGAVSAIAVVTIVAANSGGVGRTAGVLPGTSTATLTVAATASGTNAAAPPVGSDITPAADIPSRAIAIGTLETQDYQAVARQLVTHAPSDGADFAWFTITGCNETTREPVADAPTLLKALIHGTLQLEQVVDNADGTYQAVFRDDGESAIVLNGGEAGITSIGRACGPDAPAPTAGATATALPTSTGPTGTVPTGIYPVDTAIVAMQTQNFAALATQLVTQQRQCEAPPDGDWLSPCAPGVSHGTKQAVYLVAGCDAPTWMPASTAGETIAGMLSGTAHIYGVRQNPDSTYSAIFQDNNDSAFTLTISNAGITTVSRACGAPPDAVLNAGGKVIAGPFT